MNETDERIKKLHNRGLSPKQIVRKIGRPGNISRVMKAIGEAKKMMCQCCGKQEAKYELFTDAKKICKACKERICIRCFNEPIKLARLIERG